MSHCERLAREAMKTTAGSSAWQLWKAHAKTCDTCAKDQKILRALQDLTSDQGETLGMARTKALQEALAQQKREPGKNRIMQVLAIAGIAAILIIAILVTPNKKPFTLTDPPQQWSKIAANPEWDWQTDHPLRRRIQTLRDDFRTPKTKLKESSDLQPLKHRLERFRENLNSEF